jgi:hypothetical protein
MALINWLLNPKNTHKVKTIFFFMIFVYREICIYNIFFRDLTICKLI